MNRFNITDLPLFGLKRIQRTVIGDARGFLSRLFCAEELAAAGWTRPIVQINHTLTARRGTVRGMHFQHPPQAEMKLVSCIRGQVFDVAVDLRQGSSTLLQWHGEILSATNHYALLIPEGFAHGFQTLTDDCELLYLHTSTYAPDAEGGCHPQDPALGINWPLPVADLSDRDGGHPFITRAYAGICV